MPMFLAPFSLFGLPSGVSMIESFDLDISNYNSNLSSAASKLNDINNLYDLLNKSLSEVNSSTESMNIPDGLGEELTKMKATINELNAKYAAMLEGMKK